MFWLRPEAQGGSFRKKSYRYCDAGAMEHKCVNFFTGKKVFRMVMGMIIKPFASTVFLFFVKY